MESLSREELFTVAGYSLQGGFPEQGIKYLARAIEMDPVLTEMQQNLFFATYRCIANRFRSGIDDINMTLGDVESEEDAKCLMMMKVDIASQLVGLCSQVYAIIGDIILPRVENPAERAVYFLVLADFTRFVAELGIEQSESAAATSLGHYTAAKEAASSVLPVEDPVYLGIILNMAKLLNDVMGQTQQAVELAETTYNAAIANIGNLDPVKAAEAREVLQDLKDNTISWMTSDADE